VPNDRDHPPDTASMPADYYRRHADRLRRLAEEATTPAVKAQLREIVRKYERLAKGIDDGMPPTGC
jgi:hypothetical protein